MLSLIHLRHWLRHSRFARTLMLVLTVTVALASLPRWERHAHDLDDQTHVHVHVHEMPGDPDHGSPAVDDGDSDDGLGQVMHTHAAATMAATLPALTAASLAEPTPEAWHPNRAVPSAPSSAPSPPDRPPIG